MNRIVSLIVFPALLLVSGCKSIMHVSSSSFLTNFSLEELVKKNRSPSGMICAKGGMGGGGSVVGFVGRNESSSNKRSSFSCRIEGDSFDEAGFAASLKAEVEEEIIRSGAKIIKQGSSDPAGFYFEYGEGQIHGRISIVGKRRDGGYYSLDADLAEKSD